jgi:ABC-2 type transport system permease protein
MTLAAPTFFLTLRALVQFPRLPAVLVFSMVPPILQLLLFGAIFGKLPDQIDTFPTDNYYEYLAPAVVFFTTVLGVANAGVALANDFKTGYFHKLILAPISMNAVLLGRLFADGVRVFLQAGLILVLALAFGARVATGVPGALMMLLISTLFSLFTVGIIVANIGLRSKSEQAVQAIFPLFFLLIFLTTAFLPKVSMGSDVIRTIIDVNPAEYVVQLMRELMLDGWHLDSLALAAGIIAGCMVIA